MTHVAQSQNDKSKLSFLASFGTELSNETQAFEETLSASFGRGFNLFQVAFIKYVIFKLNDTDVFRIN